MHQKNNLYILYYNKIHGLNIQRFYHILDPLSFFSFFHISGTSVGSENRFARLTTRLTIGVIPSWQ